MRWRFLGRCPARAVDLNVGLVLGARQAVTEDGVVIDDEDPVHRTAGTRDT